MQQEESVIILKGKVAIEFSQAFPDLAPLERIGNDYAVTLYIYKQKELNEFNLKLTTLTYPWKD